MDKTVLRYFRTLKGKATFMKDISLTAMILILAVFNESLAFRELLTPSKQIN